MRKFIVILFLSVYGIVNVLLPRIDMATLRDMYAQCQKEDPDIDLLDFVTEHLLNLSNPFEKSDTEFNEKNDKSHLPIHKIDLSAPLDFTLAPSFYKEPTSSELYSSNKTYPAIPKLYLSEGHLSRIFHPPIPVLFS